MWWQSYLPKYLNNVLLDRFEVKRFLSSALEQDQCIIGVLAKLHAENILWCNRALVNMFVGVLQIELMAAQYDARTAAEALTSAQEQVSDLSWHLEDSHSRLAELEASCSEASNAREAAEQRAAELEDQVPLFPILAASLHAG